MRWLLSFIVVLGWSILARGGVVETMDGKKIEGEVKLASDGVEVKPAKAAAVRVPVEKVKRVVLGEEKKQSPAEPVWNDFDLGEGRIRGVSSMLDEGRLQLTFGGAGFGARRKARSDQLQFRFQPVVGDFEASCRIQTTDGMTTLGRVGLMARENMDALAVFAATCCGERVYRTTEFYARDQPGDVAGIVGTSERAVLGSTWVKLTRSGDVFRGFESIDGRTWRQVAEQKVVMAGGAAGEVFVGPFGFGGLGSTGGGTAVFDHLEVTQTGRGGKAITATPALGYVTPSGSVVAVKSIVLGERGVRAARDGAAEAPLPTGQVARIVCGARYGLFADRIETGKTGVLLSGGDFVDGQVYRLGEGNAVGLTSVVFGPKKFDMKTEVAAAVLGDVTPRGEWLVRAKDGSAYRGDGLLIGVDGVAVEEATIGKVKVAAGAVVEVERAGK